MIGNPLANKWPTIQGNSQPSPMTHQLGEIKPGGSMIATKKQIGPEHTNSTNGIQTAINIFFIYPLHIFCPSIHFLF